MTKATYDFVMTPLYPDPPIRGLADVRSDPDDDRPSDSPRSGDFMPVYMPTRFGGRTICDLPDKRESSEHPKRELRILNVVLLALTCAGLGFIAVSVWAVVYPVPPHVPLNVMGFEKP